MAYAEHYEVDCLGLEVGLSRTYEFVTAPLPGQPTNQHELIQEAKTHLTNENLAKPPYTGVIFNVRLVRVTEV